MNFIGGLLGFYLGIYLQVSARQKIMDSHVQKFGVIYHYIEFICSMISNALQNLRVLKKTYQILILLSKICLHCNKIKEQAWRYNLPYSEQTGAGEV